MGERGGSDCLAVATEVGPDVDYYAVLWDAVYSLRDCDGVSVIWPLDEFGVGVVFVVSGDDFKLELWWVGGPHTKAVVGLVA